MDWEVFEEEAAEAVDLTAWELDERADSTLRLTLCFEDSTNAEGRLALKLPAEAAKSLAQTLLRIAGGHQPARPVR